MHRESIYKHYTPAVTDPQTNSGQSYWFAFYSNKMLVAVNNDKFSIPYLRSLEDLSIHPVRTQYLGLLQGRPCYSAELSSENSIPAGMSFKELRLLYGALDEDLYHLAGKAFQIVSWDQSHQFCGRCGSPTQEQPGERAKICPKCGFISYTRICPAVITAILKDNKILLAHAKGFKGNIYSLIAGFLEPGETLEECVKREIREEVGIQVKNVRFFGSQPWPYPNSMMIGFTAEYESGNISVDREEIVDAGWYDADNLPELPPEMSIARQIINWYISQYKQRK